MQKLYAYFPLNSGIVPGDLKSLAIPLAIYVAACMVLRVLSWALNWVPLVGWLLGLVFSLLGLYCVAGIILALLRYFDRAN